MGFTVQKFCGSLIFTVLLGLGACTRQSEPAVSTVDQVDLSRYMGTWYEIARLPNWFQKKCVSDTTAFYTLTQDHVTVLNRCKIKNGSWASASGIAYPVAGSGNAKLRVSFFRPFYGDYWVIALDPFYQWVLVGSPQRDYGWILSRTPSLSASTMQLIQRQARLQGYQPDQFLMTVQNRK